MENTDMLFIQIDTITINNDKGYYVSIDDKYGTQNTVPLSDT